MWDNYCFNHAHHSYIWLWTDTQFCLSSTAVLQVCCHDTFQLRPLKTQVSKLTLSHICKWIIINTFLNQLWNIQAVYNLHLLVYEIDKGKLNYDNRKWHILNETKQKLKGMYNLTQSLYLSYTQMTTDYMNMVTDSVLQLWYNLRHSYWSEYYYSPVSVQEIGRPTVHIIFFSPIAWC